MVGDTTFSGSGVVNISGNGSGGAGEIGTDGNGRTLTNQLTIQGTGVIGSNDAVYQNLSLSNSGTIDANTNGGTLSIQGTGGAFANTGTLAATNGGVLNLATSAAINNAGGAVTAGAGSAVTLYTSVQGGTLNTLGNGVIQTGSAGATLDGSTQGAITISDGSTYTATSGLVTSVTGTLKLGTVSGGALALSGALRLVGDTTLSGPGGAVVNISGNNTGNTGEIGTDGNGRLLTNNVTIQGTGVIGSNDGAEFQNLSLTNNGTINANTSSGSGTLSIQGTGGSIINAGTLEATHGGVLNLATAAAINNTGGNITASGAGSSVGVFTTIQGGTLNTLGNGVIKTGSSAAVLDGSTYGAVTLSDGSTYTATSGLVTSVAGTLNLGTISGGALALNGALRLVGDTALSGPGGAVVNISGNNTGNTGEIGTDGNGRLLTNNVTIQGTGVIGSNDGAEFQNLSLTNNGTINANTSSGSGTLSIQGTGGSIINAGTLEATHGGLLNLATSAPINNSSGNIAASGNDGGGANSTVTVNTTIQGGTLNTSDGGVIRTGASGAFLDGRASPITLSDGSTYTATAAFQTSIAGTLNLGTVAGGTLALNGGLRLVGDTTLSGPAGAVVNISGNNTGNTGEIGTDGNGRLLTNNVTIQGTGAIGSNDGFESQNLSLTNNGTIDANISGGTLSIRGTGGSITNAGTFEATHGGLLNLATSAPINNSSGAITASGAGSTVTVNTTIQGGTLNTSGGGVLQTGTNGAFLDGRASPIMLSDGSTYTATAGIQTNIAGTLNLGTVAGSALALNGGLKLVGDTTLSGPNGAVVNISGNNTGNTGEIGTDGNGRLLTNNVTIQGTGAIGSNDGFESQNLSLANNGTIDANTSSGTLSIQGSGGTITNAGTFEATHGGLLTLATQAPINNSGGAITAAGAGSTVTVFTTIQGGTLNTAGGGIIQTGSNGTTLDGSTHGAILVSDGSAYTATSELTTNIAGTLTLGAVSGGSLALAGALRLIGDTTLSGPGVVNISGTGGGATGEIGTDGNGRTLTNNATIQGYGVIGSNDAVSQNLTLNNNGTIYANTSGQTLALRGTGGNTNNGTFEVAPGATLLVSSNLTNFGGNTLTGGAYIVNGAAGNTGTMQLSSIGNASAGEIVNNAAKIVLNGPNANTLLVDAGGNNALKPLAANTTASSSLTIEGGYSFAAIGAFTNTGAVNLNSGGSFGATSFTNNNLTFGNGTVTVAISNNGTVEANGGTLSAQAITGAGGTIKSDAGATLDLSGATADSTAKNLVNNGHLNIGTHNVTVTSNYANSSFGSGNAFNNHANVSGTGSILASSATQDVSAGAALSGSTLNLGVVRGGGVLATTLTISNNGLSTNLIGAVQNTGAPNVTLNGGSNGADWTAAANGGTAAVTVAFSSSGSLNGETLKVVNNFDNVASQTLNLEGTVTQVAVATLSSTGSSSISGGGTSYVLDLGSFSHSGSGNASIDVTNDIPASIYAELLSGSFLQTDSNGFTFNDSSFSLGGNETALGDTVGFSALGLSNGSYSDTITFNGVSSFTGLSDYNLSPISVTVEADVTNVGAAPEPSTWAMMLLGLSGLGLVGYRRRRARATA